MNVGVVLKILRCLPGFRQDRLAWLLGGHQDGLMDALERQSGAASPSLRVRIGAMLRVMRLAAGFLWLARWRSGRGVWRGSPPGLTGLSNSTANGFPQTTFLRG